MLLHGTQLLKEVRYIRVFAIDGAAIRCVPVIGSQFDIGAITDE